MNLDLHGVGSSKSKVIVSSESETNEVEDSLSNQVTYSYIQNYHHTLCPALNIFYILANYSQMTIKYIISVGKTGAAL